MLKTIHWLLGVMTPILFVAGALAAESIISKADVERIFSMRKAEWEAYAPRIADPKWNVQLKRVDTGTGVMAFEPSTGMGLSIQPLYLDDKDPPTMLIVGSFYPIGRTPGNLAASEREMEQEAQRHLGHVYAVSARYVKLPPSWEGIELSVTRSANAPR